MSNINTASSPAQPGPTKDAATASKLLRLEGITKEYQLGADIIQALKGVDLTVLEGEFTVVAGPSGSGKTTLLNIIGCLDRPSGGNYFVDGEQVATRDFDALAELRNHKIGFVFQNFNLIPILSAYENVEFPLLVNPRPITAQERRDRVMSLLKDVGLEDRWKQRPDQLSGGQKQRVAVARALVTQPRLVLADEPTANLDTRTAIQIIELMQKLNAEKRTTFLFSTHDDRIVDRAKRIVHIRDGKIDG
jgi:putative ABC transport system ATP-binding protein